MQIRVCTLYVYISPLDKPITASVRIPVCIVCNCPRFDKLDAYGIMVDKWAALVLIEFAVLSPGAYPFNICTHTMYVHDKEGASC